MLNPVTADCTSVTAHIISISYPKKFGTELKSLSGLGVGTQTNFTCNSCMLL